MAHYVVLTFRSEVEAHVVGQVIREKCAREPRVLNLEQLESIVRMARHVDVLPTSQTQEMPLPPRPVTPAYGTNYGAARSDETLPPPTSATLERRG